MGSGGSQAMTSAVLFLRGKQGCQGSGGAHIFADQE